MSPESQRVALAELCGYDTDLIGVCRCGDSIKGHGYDHTPVPMLKITDIPDYLNDLNYVHGAEGALLEGMACVMEYERQVRAITLRDAAEGSGLYERIIRATAAQRCEALLKTLGKWTE